MGVVGSFDLKSAIREITLQVLKEYGFMPNKDEEDKHDAIQEGAERGVSADARGLVEHMAEDMAARKIDYHKDVVEPVEACLGYKIEADGLMEDLESRVR